MNKNGWYYRKQTTDRFSEFGPFTREEMLRFLNEGIIDKDTQTRYGALPWQPLKTYLSSHRIGVLKRGKKIFSSLSRKDKRIKALYIVVFILIAVYFITKPSFFPFWSTIDARTYNGKQIPSTWTPKIHTTSPYAHPLQEPLTREKVIYFTNAARSGNGLHELKENSLLNAVAEERAKDMFEKQYFEHISPTGENDADVARRIGYRYKMIGENIAKGWYLNDKKLVDGWMQSHGHRKNILNSGFDEIGVAVVKGKFEGNEVIIGVQIFGLPSLPIE